MVQKKTLAFIDHPESFPGTGNAFKQPNGLLAVSAEIDASWLKVAYSKGIFPWYNPEEPVLWWSPNPRSVLYLDEFKLHRSLRKAVKKTAQDNSHTITLNNNFEAVIRACSEPRPYANSTWISEDIIKSYCQLHQEGFAHSVEYQIQNELVGGLYCVSIGKMVFGESMFSKQTDTSKIAFSFFVNWLKSKQVKLIDCQQSTNHLNFLGAKTITRSTFESELLTQIKQPKINWQPKTLHWNND